MRKAAVSKGAISGSQLSLINGLFVIKYNCPAAEKARQAGQYFL